MKGNKIIIILIIINILSIGIIYNFTKKDCLNNEKIIVKRMAEGEYEDYITSLNASHEDFANHIEESKAQIASAITDMGVPTSSQETLETMASNIRSITADKVSYDLIPFSFNITTAGYYSSNPTVLRADLYGTITIEEETISIDTSVAGYGKNKEFSYTFKNGIEIYAHSVTGATGNVDCELFIKGISPYVRIAGFYQSKGTYIENKHGYLIKTDLGYAIIYDDVENIG